MGWQENRIASFSIVQILDTWNLGQQRKEIPHKLFRDISISPMRKKQVSLKRSMILE